MPTCNNCGDSFPCRMVYQGKLRNFQRRKYCLVCSPFGSGNTRKLEEPQPSQEERRQKDAAKYKKWQRKARKERKAALIEMLGGECEICRYDKCHAALEFHHKDPATKKFNISIYGLCRKWETLVIEAKKCSLLCCRCHRELENGG
ncbi:HNH endonuclease [Candidatus Pacearchaeota archaeon]|nr:HNH endonuclease [Candidatus Pacearchaeota archaeon]